MRIDCNTPQRCLSLAKNIRKDTHTHTIKILATASSEKAHTFIHVITQTHFTDTQQK